MMFCTYIDSKTELLIRWENKINMSKKLNDKEYINFFFIVINNQIQIILINCYCYFSVISWLEWFEEAVTIHLAFDRYISIKKLILVFCVLLCFYSITNRINFKFFNYFSERCLIFDIDIYIYIYILAFVHYWILDANEKIIHSNVFIWYENCAGL